MKTQGTSSRPATIEEYIEASPVQARAMLRKLTSILREAVPGAEESIKWGHPVFEEKRILFSFSAHRDHLNFMPTGPSLKPFEKELKDFKTGKDTLQLPYDEPMPVDLIRKIATYRVKDVRENDAKWMY